MPTYVRLNGRLKRGLLMSDFYSNPVIDDVFERSVQDKLRIEIFAKKKRVSIWEVEKALKQMERKNDGK